ncbi:MAG: NUDIX hydrolase [Ignavibacteriales bacterium]|nr:NUDIX hydrolase [Ignavibacteriales bacterium]MCB9210578.1 NUDIX hydrolase [Ignavibacteriales bacterium]MCB9219953.1 NUDIX hydrolase [Ignavibacteriales bacterium]
MALKTWKKLTEKTIFKNNHWSYNLDNFEIEGGTKGEYHYVHTLGSTMVVPFISPNEILLVNQYRYLNQKESLEFPCGSIEDGLSIEENAIKEFREETGKSGKLKFVGEFSPYTGASDEMCTVFIAENLIDSPLPSDETEEFEIVKMQISEFEKLIKENKIWDGLTLSAWILTKNFLNI